MVLARSTGERHPSPGSPACGRAPHSAHAGGAATTDPATGKCTSGTSVRHLAQHRRCPGLHVEVQGAQRHAPLSWASNSLAVSPSFGIEFRNDGSSSPSAIPNIFPCTMGIRILASPKARVGTSLTNSLLSTVADTSRARPASNVQVVGFHDPDLVPGERRLVATAITANCPITSAALVREFGVTLQIVDVTTEETSLVVQAPAE